MSLINNTKRWYDQNPTVSLAISIFRNASRENQKLVANFLLENVFNNSKIKIHARKIPLFNRRWYDHDENVYMAVEFIRLSSANAQNQVAVEIINYLYALDSSINN